MWGRWWVKIELFLPKISCFFNLLCESTWRHRAHFMLPVENVLPQAPSGRHRRTLCGQADTGRQNPVTADEKKDMPLTWCTAFGLGHCAIWSQDCSQLSLPVIILLDDVTQNLMFVLCTSLRSIVKLLMCTCECWKQDFQGPMKAEVQRCAPLKAHLAFYRWNHVNVSRVIC